MAGLQVQVTANTRQATTAIGRLNDQIDGLATAIGAVAFVSGITAAVKGYDEQQKAIAGVNSALEVTRGISGKTLDGLINSASELQSKTLFGDDQILSDVSNQLLTFQNISGTVFDRAQQAALDLTTVLKNDLKGQSIQLGKALQDPVKGVAALSKAGVTFTDGQKEQIKTFVESNNIMAAQNIILKEVENNYGGAAKAAALAGAGPLQQLQMRFMDIVDTIGGALMPIINDIAGVFSWLATLIEGNTEVFKAVVQIIVTLVSVGLVVVGVIKAIAAAQAIWNAILLANPVMLIITAVLALIAVLVVFARKYEGWGKSFKAITEIIKIVFIGLADSIKTNVLIMINKLQIFWEYLKVIGDSVFNIFSGIGQALMSVLKGDFAGAKDIMKNAMEGAFNFENDAIKKLQDENNKLNESLEARQKIRAEEIRLQKLNIGLTKKGENTVKTSAVLDPTDPNADDLSGKASKSGMKSIIINIDSIVKNQTIQQNEDPLVVKDLVTRALLSAIADASIYA